METISVPVEIGPAVLDLSDAPEPIKDLVDWLAKEGFVTSRELISDCFNQDTFLEVGDLNVHVNVTRGDWALGIGLRNMTTTFHPDTWEEWMKGASLPAELSTLDHQVEFIKQKWSAAVELATSNPEAEMQLTTLDSDWVERQLGFRPPQRSSEP